MADTVSISNMSTAGDYIGDSDRDAQSDCWNRYETTSSVGEGIRELGCAKEVLIRVDLDLAYSSEKLLNLEILLMHVADKESDYEALASENDNVWAEFAEKGLEFDFLSGLLDSELQELDSFMTSLQTELEDARLKISSCEHLIEAFNEMQDKLKDLEESFKQSRNQISDMRRQSAKFKRTILAFGNNNKDADFADNGQFSNMNPKLKMQTAEQQRHILRMLEKSLARELDMEKKLSDSRVNEEELKMKLRSSEDEVLCMEEAIEDNWGRLLEAENAAAVLEAASKELMGRLQVVQFNLNGSVQREGQMKSKLQDSMDEMKSKKSSIQKLVSSGSELDKSLLEQTDTLKASLKEAEDKYIIASSEALTLKEKVQSLEERVKVSEAELMTVKASMDESHEHNNILSSEITDMETVNEDLKADICKVENRAVSLEARCTLLTETNLELNQELIKRSVNDTDKVNLLENQLRDSDIQLQHAKASAEAAQEQQNMLYSAISDMENLIDDLKLRVSKAENRAESAEVKCTLLSETNMELNDELSFLRGRMECLETSLHEADDAKTATAKDINIRTKLITDLVVQLAVERERLHNQICSLTKQNKLLAEHFLQSKKDFSTSMSHIRNENKELSSKDGSTSASCTKASEEAATDSLSSSFQVDRSSVCENEVEPSISKEEDVSDVGTVRTIDAAQLNRKHYLLAILVFLVAFFVFYLFHKE